MGQLQDSSRVYRQEKKRRRLAKARQASEETDAVGEKSDTSTPNHVPPQRDMVEETRGRGDFSKDQTKFIDRSRCESRSEKGRPRLDTDMYKVFDGSALMAIGV